MTGSNGQLGKCIQKIEEEYPSLSFCFVDSKELNIGQESLVRNFFKGKFFDFVINCAAYTNVDKAEKEAEKAFLVNAEGVKNLAEVCKQNNSTLIHISTDYVFDGEKQTPYTECDLTNPINIYGKSKRDGEKHIEEVLEKYFIIRTSWLYSEFGHNFFKTIIKKSESEQQLSIITSEIGTPTNANDLVDFIMHLIKNQSKKHGIYNYSNLGEATWYDFAKEILRVFSKLDSVQLKKTDNYITFARRPRYSVLEKEKVKSTFDLTIPDWKKSLENLYAIIQ
ncbi:dTDP-4-dehydrorhamnose reductase [Aquimarina sp. 2201CG1-2-11]|uniref:dTDP-4-dehydrorhamnose reductase n=1 Tax=Aquimarina discodermiae TaxID=3231043 RepID=UPI0034636F89